MARRVMLMAFVPLLLGFSSTGCWGQAVGVDNGFAIVDPNTKANPDLAYVILYCRGKQQIYSTLVDCRETVQMALKRFGPLPKYGNQTYLICLQRVEKNSGTPMVWPVNWDGVGAFGNPETDYPLEPGDRILVCSRVPETPHLVKIWAPHLRIWNMIEQAGAEVSDKWRSFWTR